MAAKEYGYNWVAVYSAGEPEWKKEGLPLWGNEPSGVADVAPVELPVVPPGKLPRSINAADFRKLVTETPNEVVVLDVRSAGEYAAGHLPGAINLPDDQFHANYDELVKKVPTNKRVLIHCVTGIRAEGVYHALATRGKYENTHGVQFLNATMSISADGSFTVQ
ncbi:rhodanese-like domain-containing protein [Desulfurivibrio sp. D14AmB]|uniref:rhodanese-like domain-containing protein n=1 Tax=Desulfurivibrio sp. D14AmB TaxID=3374370 RepID=UPI00376EF4B9